MSGIRLQVWKCNGPMTGASPCLQAQASGLLVQSNIQVDGEKVKLEKDEWTLSLLLFFKGICSAKKWPSQLKECVSGQAHKSPMGGNTGNRNHCCHPLKKSVERQQCTWGMGKKMQGCSPIQWKMCMTCYKNPVRREEGCVMYLRKQSITTLKKKPGEGIGGCDLLLKPNNRSPCNLHWLPSKLTKIPPPSPPSNGETNTCKQ